MASDPATEAAQRAFAAIEDDSLAYANHRDKRLTIAAAREALAPLRDFSKGHRGQSREVDDLLDDLAPLIYPESELS